MPIKNNQGSDNIPQLRFPEFTGEWEKKKLGEVILSIESGTSVNSIDQPILNKLQYGILKTSCVSKGEFSPHENKKIIDSEISRVTLNPVKDSILVSRMNTPQLVGENGYIDKDYLNLFIPDRLWLLKTLPNYSARFLNYILTTGNIRTIISNIATGTSNSMKNISQPNFLSIESYFPIKPEQKEQTKIASFLTAVDKKIQALKKKHRLLQQYKKGVMQKLFSQELRFKDENGEEFAEWEKKKLGEIFYSEKGKGISKNKIVENGKYQCVLYGELYTKYNEVIFEVESKTNEEDGTKSMIGDLLIPSSTTTTGIDLANVTALNKSGVLLGGDITILRSNAQINNVFYAYYLSNYKKDEIASYAQGITIVHLYYSHIKEMVIDLPSHKEQTFIANYLSAIDEKINQTQLQIEKMEVWKKGLLQKMFC